MGSGWIEPPRAAHPAAIRLVGGPGRCVGRLEVLWEQQWGTVCDDRWALPHAAVVCRQLGCGDALSAPGSAPFGSGEGPIWLDDMECNGTEAELSACRTRPWGEHNCDHGEDAGVVCSGKSVGIIHRDLLPKSEFIHQGHP
ncbi:scavenger receptor cysteine-rich type 1 protein M130-like protein [Amazona aestiva]|uniref:Scavenger receptor cysteine-rich type 1 protein M130-like protein n=1 Tax=Amazona aestiva TaxID=12930 RepID=A0A0Q3MQ86_AMAAE|nr:scavenger receptor cysteine-rich type 1 protein M130-like protein [Amazona aestiva]